MPAPSAKRKKRSGGFAAAGARSISLCGCCESEDPRPWILCGAGAARLRVALLSALVTAVQSQQRGDNFVVPALPGSSGCRGVAEFLGTSSPSSSSLL